MNDMFLDYLEQMIADEQNQNYASPLAQMWLDFEADMVYQQYIDSLPKTDVLVGEIVEWDSSDLWLDE